LGRKGDQLKESKKGKDGKSKKGNGEGKKNERFLNGGDLHTGERTHPENALQKAFEREGEAGASVRL